MVLLIDLILLLALVLSVVIGWRRGFVKTLSGFLIYVLSFGFANALHRLLSVYIIKLPFLSAMVTDMEMPVFAENATFLDKLRHILAFSKEYALGDPAGATETMQAMLKNYMAEMIASVLAFILIFALSVVLLKLLLWAIDSFVKKIPVIKQANGFLGGLVGLFNGLIWTWALSNIFVTILHPFLYDLWPDIFVAEIADSFFVTLCTKINPITYLFELINLIS